MNPHHISWNCLQNNTIGNILFNHQLQNNYFIHHTIGHIRFPKNLQDHQPSTVYLAISNSTINITQLKTHWYELSLDHVPLTSLLNRETAISIFEWRDLKNAHWNNIKSFMRNEIILLRNIHEEIGIENVSEVLI